jgi:hypothetical protein
MQYRTFAPRSQDTDPYTTLETYRLTRAAWFALYAPDAGRHDLLLADDVPSVYRNLFDAILDGNRGLARIAAAGGDELALLDVVARLPRPRQIPTRRLELPDNPDLAAALFGHVADELELDGVGVGQWPGMPQHTCAAAEAVGTVITFRGNRTSAARMFNPTWRTCPACRHLRARRIARQTLLTIGVHGPMTYAIMPAADFRKWTAAQRQRLHRGGDMTHYRAMPQEGGAVFVVATGDALADGASVPVDRAALHTLISDHCVTPDGKNCSSSRGFGGKYKRLRGDGRDDDDARAGAVQRWTDSGLEAVAAALGATVRAGRDRFSVLVDEETARERLHLAGVALRDKKIVTHLVQGKRGKTCTKSVTETRARGRKAHPAAPTDTVTGGEGGGQCAITFQ